MFQRLYDKNSAIICWTAHCFLTLLCFLTVYKYEWIATPLIWRRSACYTRYQCRRPRSTRPRMHDIVRNVDRRINIAQYCTPETMSSAIHRQQLLTAAACPCLSVDFCMFSRAVNYTWCRWAVMVRGRGGRSAVDCSLQYYNKPVSWHMLHKRMDY